MKRLWYFLLGFITAFIVLFGSVFGVGYYFYTKGTIGWFAEKTGFGVDQYIDSSADVDIKSMTIQQIVSDVAKTSGSFGNMSLNDLQKRYGLKFAKMLDDAFPMPEALFAVPLNKLTSQEGVNTIVDNTRFDYIFRLAPDLLGDVAQAQLNDKSFGLIRNGQFEQFLTGVQMGAFMQTPYDYDANEFVIADKNDPTLTEAISIADLGVLYGKMTGDDADVLAGVEYVLKDIKLKRLITGKDEIFKEKTFGDIFVEQNGAVAFSVDELVKNVYAGDILGYTPVYLADGIQIDYWTDANGNKVENVMQQVANIKVSEFIDGSANLDTIIQTFGDVQLGELLGFKNVDGVWLDKNSNAPADGIVKAFADMKISEMQGETLQNKINTLKISDIMQCETGLMKALANSTINSLQNDVMQVQIGVILDYTYNDVAGVWKDKDGNDVTGIIGAVADLTPNNLSTGVNKISIGTVLGMYQKDGIWYKDKDYTDKATGIHAVLAKYTIGGDTGIANGLNTIKFGEVMGLYLGNDDKWYEDEDCTILAEGLSASLADLSFDTFNADKVEEIVKGLKIGDIFQTEGSKLFSLVPDDTTIENLPSAIEDALDALCVQDALDLGIITIDDPVTISALDSTFAGWRNLTMEAFLDALIQKAIYNSLP